jgi:hypothetical protein
VVVAAFARRGVELTRGCNRNLGIVSFSILILSFQGEREEEVM